MGYDPILTLSRRGGKSSLVRATTSDERPDLEEMVGEGKRGERRMTGGGGAKSGGHGGRERGERRA